MLQSIPSDEIGDLVTQFVNLIVALLQLLFDVTGAGGAILLAFLQLFSNSEFRIAIVVIILLIPVVVLLRKPS